MGPVGQGVRGGVSSAWGGGSFFGNPYMDYATQLCKDPVSNQPGFHEMSRVRVLITADMKAGLF